MKKKRRKFSSEFKLKVVLDSLRERQSLTELAHEHQLHPNQISKWKAEFLENAKQYMSVTTDPSNKIDLDKELEKLYAKIGQLQMENDYLKKRLG